MVRIAHFSSEGTDNVLILKQNATHSETGLAATLGQEATLDEDVSIHMVLSFELVSYLLLDSISTFSST